MDLRVDLELPRELSRGQLLVARVTVTNLGAEPRAVSARLHPAEGDLSFRVRDAAGRDLRLIGRHQVDSPPRTVELAPGEAIAAGVNLPTTLAGSGFEQPGVYRVSAVLLPSVREAPVSSTSRELIVRLSRGEEDRATAALLGQMVTIEALALGDLDPGSPADAALRELAGAGPHGPGATVAALVAAASQARRGGSPEELQRLLAGIDEDVVGWLVTAALPPAPDPDDPLVQAAVAVLEAAGSPQAERALKMVRGEPIPADEAGGHER